MKMEKSSGFVVYRYENNKLLYLLLKYPPSKEAKDVDYWGLPKGHLEGDEGLLEAALRELQEETGLKKQDLDIKEDFKEWNKYYFKHEGETIFKIVSYFLAETKKETVKVSHEHSDFKWVTFEDAMKLIPFDNTKKIVQKADKFI